MASYETNINKELAAKVSIAYDKSTNWATVNPILMKGQIACSSDLNMYKIGDGKNSWSDLEYNNARSLDGLLTSVRELNYVRGLTSNLQNHLDRIDGSISINQNNIGQLGTALGDLSSRVNDAENSISNNYTDASSQLSELSGRMSAAEHNIAGIQAINTSQDARISSVNGNVNSLANRVTSLEDHEQYITGAATSIIGEDLPAEMVVVTDRDGKIATSNIPQRELSFLAGVTSSIQVQLNAKEEELHGAVTSITQTNLTNSRALISDINGKVAVSSVTSSELNYLSGVTKNIQAQLDSKQNKGEVYIHPQYTPRATGLYKFSVDDMGHVFGASLVTEDDIYRLGVPTKASMVITNNAQSIQDTTSELTNGSVHINMIQNRATTTSHKLYGTGASEVLTDEFANIVIHSDDTHHQSKLAINKTAASVSSTKTALDNGEVRLNIVENGEVRSSHKITGAGSTEVVTDTSGNIVINSVNTTSLVDMDGVLTVDKGGTGKSSLSQNEVLIGNGTGSIKTKAIDYVSGGHENSTDLISSGAVYSGLASKIDITEIGKAGGVASLDGNGKVPSSQLPSFVDDVVEATEKDAFPITGEAGKIYVDKTTNKTYRWGGSDYVEISESLAIGTTSSTAFRGDYGQIAYNHSQSTHARVDASNVKPSSSNGHLVIDDGDVTVYSHPLYVENTVSNLYKITVDEAGHVSSMNPVTKADIIDIGIPGDNTDTHWTSKNIVNSDNTKNTNTTTILNNGSVYLNHIENGEVRSSHKISGSGATEVTSDASGNIVVSSTNTTYNTMSSDEAKTGTATEGKLITAKALNDAILNKGYTTTTGTVRSVTVSNGLTGGTITDTGTIKANLKSFSNMLTDAVSVTEQANRIYPVGLDKSGYLAVNVPWVDTDVNTTYTASTGLKLSGTDIQADLVSTTKMAYDSSSVSEVDGRVYPVALDKSGHLAVSVPWVNTDTETVYTAGIGMSLNDYTFKTKLRSETKLANASQAATETSGRIYPVVQDKDGYLAVNVPWVDTNTDTTYATGVGLTNVGTTFKANLRNETKINATSDNAGVVTGRVYAVGVDKDGYLAVSVPWSDTTETLTSLGIPNVTNYDQSVAIKNITRSGTTFTFTRLDGTTGTFSQQDNNTWNALVGATNNTDGIGGYISADPPSDGYNTKFFRADGTWAVPPNDNTHYQTHIYVGNGVNAANNNTTNGNTKIAVSDDAFVHGTITVIGQGGTTVTSDATGKMYIKSLRNISMSITKPSTEGLWFSNIHEIDPEDVVSIDDMLTDIVYEIGEEVVEDLGG